MRTLKPWTVNYLHKGNTALGFYYESLVWSIWPHSLVKGHVAQPLAPPYTYTVGPSLRLGEAWSGRAEIKEHRGPDGTCPPLLGLPALVGLVPPKWLPLVASRLEKGRVEAFLSSGR